MIIIIIVTKRIKKKEDREEREKKKGKRLPRECGKCPCEQQAIGRAHVE